MKNYFEILHQIIQDSMDCDGLKQENLTQNLNQFDFNQSNPTSKLFQTHDYRLRGNLFKMINQQKHDKIFSVLTVYEGLQFIGDILKISKRVKQLKLVRNKITDEGACKLLDCLVYNTNQVFQSLHLSSNMITERTLDYFISLVRNSPQGCSLPKSLYLNQTLINATKAKKKIEDLKRVGYLVNI